MIGHGVLVCFVNMWMETGNVLSEYVPLGPDDISAGKMIVGYNGNK